MEPSIPEIEIDLFLNTVDEAMDLALANRAGDGASELRYGVRRAEAFSDEEWGAQLAERYRTALLNYCLKHRVRVQSSDSSPSVD